MTKKGVKEIKDSRSEEDVVCRAPIVVILGGNEYKVAPLVIRDSREWRQKVIKLIAPIPQLVKISSDDAEGFENALTQFLVTMPDDSIELFFEYAKDLDREEIESIATDAEMAVAFQEVIKIAFPLAASLPKVMQRVSQ